MAAGREQMDRGDGPVKYAAAVKVSVNGQVLYRNRCEHCDMLISIGQTRCHSCAMRGRGFQGTPNRERCGRCRRRFVRAGEICGACRELDS